MQGRKLLATLAVIGISRFAYPGEASPPDYLKAKPEAVEAWKDLRFGMFICWGPVTLTGQEIGWLRGGERRDPYANNNPGKTPVEVYDNLYKTWKPDKFNARTWIKVAQDGGAKYVIFLVKHHDGFCLYDSKLTDYKSTAPEAAWRYDVMKDVADACQEAGIKLIVYYSQRDWHHPDYGTANHTRYIQYLHGQIRELLTNYGKIDGLWFDLGGRPKDWDSEELFKMARQLQPWLVINNRCGLPGDFDTPENRVGYFRNDRPWESCATLNHQWSWRPNDTMRSLEECIHMLVGCDIGDGNFALNTGPMPNGEIEPQQVDRFRQIGQWLKKCGESIYGTRGGPFRAPDEQKRRQDGYYGKFTIAGGGYWGGSTHKGNAVYLHILRWPTDTILLPPIERKIVTHNVLTGGTANVEQTDQGIKVSVPAEQRDALDTIVKLVLDGPAASVPVQPPR